MKLWSASRARSLSPHPCLPSRRACRIGYASCTGDAQSIRGAKALVRFTREESFPSDPQSAKSGCASRTKDEQSIDFHHPGCVRRIGFASYILNVCSIRVHKPGCVRRMRATYWSCMRCMHSRGKLWSASAKPAALRDEPFPSALVCHPRCVCRIKASCTSDAQSFILHHPGCVCRIGYASYIL